MSSELDKHRTMALTQDVMSVLSDATAADAVSALANSLLSVMVNTEIIYRMMKDDKKLVIVPSDAGIPDVKRIIMAREVAGEGKKLCDFIEGVVNKEFEGLDTKPSSSQLIMALTLFINDVISLEHQSEEPSEEPEELEEEQPDNQIPEEKKD